MAISLHDTGQRCWVMLYFTIFGLSFMVSSVTYATNLQKFDNSHCIPLQSGHISFADNDMTTSCARINEWQRLATTGIVFGALWLLIASLTQLCPLFWSHCCACDKGHKPEGEAERLAATAAAAEATTQPVEAGGSSGPTNVLVTQPAGNGGKTFVENDAHYFVKLQRKQQAYDFRRIWAACCHAFNPCARFLVILIFWLAPLILPGYLVVSLVKAGAIRASREEDSLYFPALALCITCALSVLLVIVGCVYVTNQKDDEEGDEDENLENPEQAEARRMRTWTPTFDPSYFNLNASTFRP